ncbi:MAG: O-antigen ligase family protein [Oscillospiraceae bacterium]|nr:O-antigen ligase family protein [Oscillospiraceae bacterium]
MSFKIRVHLYDLLFFLLIVLSFYFTRNVLCSIMMVVFFGYTIFQQCVRNKKTPVSFFIVGFLVFILYGAVNILIGNVVNPQVSRTMVVSLFWNFLMLYSIVQYVYMKNDIQQVLKITELGMFTAAVVVVLLSWKTITEGRLGVSIEINSNMLAMLCVYGLILSMYLRRIGKYTRGVCWFRIAFYTLVVLLSGSRKGLIMIAVGVAVIQLFVDRRRLLKSVLITATAVAAVYILIMNVEVLYNIIGTRVESLLELLAEGSTEEGSLNSRQRLIKIGWSYIKEKPWTGYGYGSFWTFPRVLAISGDNIGVYSHNNYVELLTGGGIIALVLYYIPMIYLLVKLFKRTSMDISMPYLLAILVSKLAIEYAYVSYNGRTDTYILAIVVGCVLVSGKTKNNAIENLKLS